MNTTRTSSAGVELDPDAFEIHRAKLRDGAEMAYIREGIGGFPLVLHHGCVETKRLFWPNIKPLAEAGFEVIVPDARGFGDSTITSDPAGWPDLALNSRDLEDLVTGLGHESVVTAAGDYGSGVIQDLALRFPDLVRRQITWNGFSPYLPEEYEAAGVGGNQVDDINEISDYFTRHSTEADQLAAEHDTPEKRRGYNVGFYRKRAWKTGGEEFWGLAAEGGFDEASANFMSEPFEDATAFRAQFAPYEATIDPSRASEPPLLDRVNTVTETLVLWGVEDKIVDHNFALRAPVAFSNIVGPFLVDGSGHFLSWEKPELFNKTLIAYCRDLL